jgi:hypothetical protein
VSTSLIGEFLFAAVRLLRLVPSWGSFFSFFGAAAFFGAAFFLVSAFSSPSSFLSAFFPVLALGFCALAGASCSSSASSFSSSLDSDSLALESEFSAFFSSDFFLLSDLASGAPFLGSFLLPASFS